MANRDYPDFVESTGYGTGEGLGGWNCRHSFGPAFEGVDPVYTQEQLDAMNAKNYTYNGEPMTRYEASQRQRHIERQIRRYKRERDGMKAAGLPTAEAESKIKKWSDIQKDFLQQTGLKRQYEREWVPLLAKIARVPNVVLQDTVSGGSLTGVVPSGATLEQVVIIAGYGTSVKFRDTPRLIAEYGGDILPWQKKSGIVNTDNFRYEVHWSEYKGKQYAQELKRRIYNAR